MSTTSKFDYDFLVGLDFNQAVCVCLGIDPNKVDADVRFNNGHHEPLSVTLKVTLTAEDIARIGYCMKAAKVKAP